MFKKYLLIVMMLCSFYVHAEYQNEFDEHHQQIFYDAGICLAALPDITSWKDTTISLQILYENIQEFQDIVDLFLIMQGVMIEDDQDASKVFIDFLDDALQQRDDNNQLRLDIIALFAGYQKIFDVFLDICPSQPEVALFFKYLQAEYRPTINQHDQLLFEHAVENFMVHFQKFQLIVQNLL